METIPLLPARIKQKVQRAWETVSASALTSWLDLPEFRVTHFEKEEDSLRLKCEYGETIAQCPRCHELSTEVHESKEREVRDLSMSGKRVILHIEGRRFQCGKCGRPFAERLVSIDHRRRQTRRYEQCVYEHCLESSRKAVAKQEKLSETTVKEIFIKWAKQSTRHSMEGPVRVLGIDELSLIKRRKQYVLVLSDLDRHWRLSRTLRCNLHIWGQGIIDQNSRGVLPC